MSKAAKQWRGAVIPVFTGLEDLWADVGGSRGRSLAGDTGYAVLRLSNHISELLRVLPSCGNS